MKRHHWMNLLRLVGAALLLWWAISRVDISEFGQLPLWSLDYGWGLLAFAFGGLYLIGTAQRWRIFCKMHEIPLTSLEAYRLSMFADFFNLYFLGALGGDGIRAFFVARKYPGKKLAIGGSILLDHISGMLAGAFLYALFTRPHAEWLTQSNTLISSAALLATDLFLGFMGFMTLMGVFALLTDRFWIDAQGQPKTPLIFRPLAPFRYIRNHKHLLFKGQLLSILSLMCGYLCYWAAGKAVAQHVPVEKLFAIMPMVDAISALPITLSGLGIRENLFVELLGVHLADGSKGAISVSLLGFFATGLWGLIGGIWLAFYRNRSSVAEIKSSLEAPQEAASTSLPAEKR